MVKALQVLAISFLPSIFFTLGVLALWYGFEDIAHVFYSTVNSSAFGLLTFLLVLFSALILFTSKRRFALLFIFYAIQIFVFRATMHMVFGFVDL